MTPEQFKIQIERLESTFGEKYFDIERLDLIRQHVMWMELGDFSHIISHMIANFRQAPLPKDFKDAVIAHKNARLGDKRTTPEIFEPGFSSGGLTKCLKEKYPGAQTIKEAIDIERLKLRVKKALE